MRQNFAPIGLLRRSQLWVALIGVPVRRLFSNFASGFSGLGLLLIRIAAGTSLIVDGAAALHSGWPALPLIFGVLQVGGGAMLAGGVWTPIAGFVAVTATISQIFASSCRIPIRALSC